MVTCGKPHTECPEVLDATVKGGSTLEDLTPEVCSSPGIHDFFFTSELNWNA
jgi:hypothetical protein